MNEQQQADDSYIESSDELSSVAILDPTTEQTTSTPEWTGPRCEKCDAPQKSGVVTICRKCGWYASLGRFVEVDPNWETDADEAQPIEPAPRKSHLQVWLGLLPCWSWVIIASVLLVVVESVVARVVTTSGSSLRTSWSLTQLMVGFLVVVGCHIFNFLVCAADDADFGVLDLLLRPLKLWLRAANNLPKKLWVANSAACGLVAVIMSLVVIGGLPYERLWDWGFQEPVKQNLMGAVMDRAKELDSRSDAGSLEEAVGDFAGTQDLDGADAEPEKPRSKADCVILGYLVDREGRLDTLFLGAAHRDKLIYAGRVTPTMPDSELRSLLQRLEASKSLRAFIPMEFQATWVEPKFACRVSFGERVKGGQLRDIQWESLLSGIKPDK